MQTLYRHFDKDGVLLYVGISKDPIRRMTQHNKSAKWYNLIATITHETFPTRDAVLLAERKAIRTEKPLYNLRHRPHAGALAIYYYYNDNEPIGSHRYYTTATNAQDAVEQLIECIRKRDIFHILQFANCPEIAEEYAEYEGLVRYKVSCDLLDSTYIEIEGEPEVYSEEFMKLIKKYKQPKEQTTNKMTTYIHIS